MHARHIRASAISLHTDGHSLNAISRQLGVARSTIREWVRDPPAALRVRSGRCFVCRSEPCPHPGPYGYLLGQYLGDGYLVTSARVPRLRIACANVYPTIASAVDSAMHTLSGNRTGFVQRVGYTDRGSYWTHWPCLFPQHGPGRKHERAIVLTPWQNELISADPWPLIRGLIHSDGCRAVNRVRVRGRTYAYVRYLFGNESADILAILGAALDSVGVEWRYNRRNSISIARARSVALMEHHVGAKQ